MSLRRRHTARRLLSLLEEERRHLRAGDVAAAAALTPRLERQARALEEMGGPPDAALDATLTQIAAAAARNARLAEAGLKGVQAARRFLADAAAVRDRLATYTGHGQRREIATPRVSADRRS